MFGAGKIMKKCPWFSWIRCIYIVEKGPSKTSSFGLRGQKATKVFCTTEFIRDRRFVKPKQ